MFLAGDVGGTKARLALFEEKKELVCLYEEKLQSRDFPDFPSLLKKFLVDHLEKRISKACFGVAGPVMGGKSHTTNLPWVINTQEIQEEFKIPCVKLINDLEANAWGIPSLRPDEFLTLNEGEKKEGNQALISAGTGLGEAGLVWDGKTHQPIPFPSEGGHADFAQRNEEEMELFRYLKKEFDHVSYERVLSGSGLYQLYRFVIDTGRGGVDREVETYLREQEPQRLITQHALEGKSKASLHAVRLFLSIYGAEAGNLALKYLASGGVFIGGGIAPHLQPFLKEGTFMESFVSKGRFRSLLSAIPVKVILNEKTALLGAARYVQEAS